MKKNNFLTAIILVVCSMVLSSFTLNHQKSVNVKPSDVTIDSQSNIVFRGLQKLRANDGGEIWFYQSGKCEMYYNDRLIVTCTYQVDGGAIKLLDENGNTVYKGSFTYSRDDRTKVAKVTIAGTTYYRVR